MSTFLLGLPACTHSDAQHHKCTHSDAQHHHGDSLNSGHYTSKIYYTNAAFHCNDERITKHTPIEEMSGDVYIAFYKSGG